MDYEVNVKELQHAMLLNGYKNNYQLAEKVGTSNYNLGQILSGKKMPSTKVMCNIIKCLGISPEEAGKIFFTPKLAKMQDSIETA